jgi:hypothetical protein
VRVAPEHVCPVATQQCKGNHVLCRQVVIRKDSAHQRYYQQQKGKVQRPDAQDAAEVKREHVDLASCLALAHEECRDQKRAQGEEQIDSECTARSDADDQLGETRWDVRLPIKVRLSGDGVTQEDEAERQEADQIQLGQIEAGRGRVWLGLLSCCSDCVASLAGRRVILHQRGLHDVIVTSTARRAALARPRALPRKAVVPNTLPFSDRERMVASEK